MYIKFYIIWNMKYVEQIPLAQIYRCNSKLEGMKSNEKAHR